MSALNKAEKELFKFQAKITHGNVDSRQEADSAFTERRKSVHDERRKSLTMRRKSEILVDEMRRHELEEKRDALRGILKIGSGKFKTEDPENDIVQDVDPSLPTSETSSPLGSVLNRPGKRPQPHDNVTTAQTVQNVMKEAETHANSGGWLNKSSHSAEKPGDTHEVRTASASSVESAVTGLSGTSSGEESTDDEEEGDEAESSESDSRDQDLEVHQAMHQIPKTLQWSKELFDKAHDPKAISDSVAAPVDLEKTSKEKKKAQEKPKFEFKRKPKQPVKSEGEPTEPQPVSIRKAPSNGEKGKKKVSKRKKVQSVKRRTSSTWEPLPAEQLQAVTSGVQAFLTQLNDGELVQTMTKTGDVRDEDEKVEEVVLVLFRHFASSVTEKSNSKHAHSMDLEEYLRCMEAIGLMPVAASKKDIIQLFRDVNNVTVSDYDKHEMSQFEFQRSLEILSKRMGLSEISALVLVDAPEEEEAEGSLAALDRAVAEGSRGRSRGSSKASAFVANVRDLSDLHLGDMKSLLKIFRERSADTAPQPELDMEKFVEVFLPLLKVEEHELQMLFMKIDVNSDGIVTWNEFSSFVLDLHTKEGLASDGDSVFDGTRMEEPDLAFHHDESVACIAHLPRHAQLVTACANGYLRSWQLGTGICVGKPLNRQVKAVPSSSSVLSMTALCGWSLLAIGSEDAKIRVFDGATLRHELTLDCSGRLPTVMTAYLFPVDADPKLSTSGQRREQRSVREALESKKLSGWLVWGDNCGDLHFVPEEQLVAFRTPQETVPVFPSSLKGTVEVKAFPAHETGGAVVWCTAVLFVPDIGLNGVLVVAGSSGAVAVVSLELKTVFHYYLQHRLAVKKLEWCGRQNNILASAGLDRAIHLWRPVAVKFGKPMLAGNLKGHNSGVLDLVFHDKRDVLFSLDSHSIVLVWDLASRTMVAKLPPLSHNPFDITHKVTRLLVAGSNRYLTTATNHPRMWKVKPLDLRDESEKLITHTTEVLATLYNRNFDHLLTVDRAGFIAIWAISTGVQVFKFMCEQVPEFYGIPEATAANFDLSERRLLVGWNQGSIQLYNFSNGTLLNNLITETSSPVISVMQIQYSRGQDCHRNFVAALEDGVILQWPNKMKERNAAPVRKIEVPTWMGADFVDIPMTCTAFGSPHTLVTGRKDGMFLEWDMQTGFLMKNEHGPITFRCLEESRIPIQAAKFLHKMEHICIAADAEGNVHFIDCDGGRKLGTVRGSKRRVVYSGIRALELDSTDSFLFAGESSGYLQVWDISQMFDDQQHFYLNMCIDVFRWKAHEAAIVRLVHMDKYNLLLSSSLEPEGSAAVWSVIGDKVGVLGHSEWTAEDIERVRDAVPTAAPGREEDEKDGWGVEKGRGRGLELWGSKIERNMASFRALGVLDSRTESAASSEGADDRQRGQLTLTIKALSHLPNRDRNSKSDPYCIITVAGHKQRRTRVIENQNNALIDEKFLYYLEGLDRTVQLEVWDHDAGGEQNHDFIGQVVMRLESLLTQGNAEEGVMLKLMRKDGKTTLKEGSIVVAVEFIPIVSALQHKAKPRSVQEHIKNALSAPHTVALLPPLRAVALPGPPQAKSAVTALATARWDSIDFRSLSVYQLQDDTKVSGFATERLDRKGRARGPAAEGGALHASPRRHVERAHGHGDSHRALPLEGGPHRFAKESLAGRLERSLDAAFAESYGQSSLAVMEANAALMRAGRVDAPKKAEVPNIKAIGDAIRMLTLERKQLESGAMNLDSEHEKKRFFRRSSLVASAAAMPMAAEQHREARERANADIASPKRRSRPPLAGDPDGRPLLNVNLAIDRAADAKGPSLPRIVRGPSGAKTAR